MDTALIIDQEEQQLVQKQQGELQHNFDDILRITRLTAEAEQIPYAGSVKPRVAWALFCSGKALLIDIRTNEELVFVGRVPDSLHVPWATGTALTRNPRFLKELEKKASKQDVILLLCRSGRRSALAAEVATKAGFTNVFNVLEGFEGNLNEQGQRGHLGGWQYYGLPWSQN
jgi:rhodanese-related sulfurtransferase